MQDQCLPPSEAMKQDQMFSKLPFLLQWPVMALCLSSNITTTFTTAQLHHELVTFDKDATAAASQSLSRELLGMSIEFCYITEYLGDVDKPNTFSHRLLQNIQDIAGAPPRIRIGGDTQDVAKYCPTCAQTLNNTFAAGNTEAVNVSFNANLFKVLNDNVPSEQQYIFGLNLGQEEVSIPLAELAAAQKYMNSSRLIGYELGNEPDFYASRGKIRPASWNVLDYIRETVNYLLEFNAFLGPTAEGDAFPGYMYGSLINHPWSQDFSIGTLIKLGVRNLVKNIRIFSEHNYFGDVCTPADAALVKLPTYLNHINTVSVTEQFVPSIHAAHSTGALYFMGETNSAACHGLAGVSDTLGAALWMLDYSLTGASLGMDGLYFHNGVTFPYSSWEPNVVNDTMPHVNGLYYSYLVFADLVSDLPPSARVAPIPSLDGASLAHYAIYSSSDPNPQKLIILNLEFTNATVPRTQRTFDISPVFDKDLSVTRLTGISSDATKGLSWAAQTVDGQGKLSGARVVEESKNGVVAVGSSEAVIVKRK